MLALRLIDFRNVLSALICLALVACAARDVTPVSISSVGDSELTCMDIRDEIRENERVALEVAGEESSVRAGNTAAVAAGLIVWPAFFALDLSEAEKIQAAALRDRNQYLEKLFQNKSCTRLVGAPSSKE